MVLTEAERLQLKDQAYRRQRRRARTLKERVDRRDRWVLDRDFQIIGLTQLADFRSAQLVARNTTIVQRDETITNQATQIATLQQQLLASNTERDNAHAAREAATTGLAAANAKLATANDNLNRALTQIHKLEGRGGGARVESDSL